MPQRISGDRVLLSTTEAVQVSGLSRVHIQRLLREEKLEGMKLGHDWLVYQDSLQAFLAQPRKPGPKPKDRPTNNSAATLSSSQENGQGDSSNHEHVSNKN